jgi:hypothetical protein
MQQCDHSHPHAYKGDVRGFLAFNIDKEEKTISDKHKDLLEISPIF